MGKLVQFMHVSLDGFVAGPNREMDWIHVDEDIFDYAAHRTEESDAALYGRVTYQMMEAYWPTAGDKPNASRHDIEHSRWYNKVDKLVMSRTMKGDHGKNLKIISDNLAPQINELKKQVKNEIIIFGSPGAAHSLMEESLIDEYWLFVNPILLGEGIPMFKNIRHRTLLVLVKEHAFTSGVVCLHYKLK